MDKISNGKTMFIAVGLFFVAIVFAFLFGHDYYKQFVQFLYKFFNGDNIQFYRVSKINFRFASGAFLYSFGLFTSLTFLLLRFSAKSHWIKRACLTVIVFFATTILISALDSKRLINESVGVKRLAYNEITYDEYWIISLSIAFAYLLITFLYSKIRKKEMVTYLIKHFRIRHKSL